MLWGSHWPVDLIRCREHVEACDRGLPTLPSRCGASSRAPTRAMLTASSISLGASCPSPCANGHMSRDQFALVQEVGGGQPAILANKLLGHSAVVGAVSTDYHQSQAYATYSAT